jgi:hypothetical protein
MSVFGARDRQMQIVLNNATFGGGYYCCPFTTQHYSRFSTHPLKTQYNKVERSDSFYCFVQEMTLIFFNDYIKEATKWQEVSIKFFHKGKLLT